MSPIAIKNYAMKSVIGLIGICLVSWILIVASTQNMDLSLVKLMMPMKSGWSVQQILMVWGMWAVMMGAMMLPSAIPVILALQRIDGQMSGTASTSLWFTVSYLATWSGFSIIATALQWGFQSINIMSPMLMLQNRTIASSILIAAGLFQMTPYKNICLEKCRTPMGFLLTEWRPGRWHPLLMGAKYGTYCIGCCGALMIILFAFGVMNLLAIIGLTIIVAAEKLLPQGDLIARIGGGVMVVWGGWTLAI